MHKRLIILYLGLLLVGQSPAQRYTDATVPMEERIEDALSRMTTEEKVALTHGWSKFMVRGVERLGIPELYTSDGPHGVRPETAWNSSEQLNWRNDSCTAFPCLISLAATWNTHLAYDYGRALGEEMRYRRKDVALGPGINLYRTPLCSRNMEYMGEDPWLTGELALQYVRGIQQNGVAACVKHFALNNQETNRHTVDVRVSDRALYELYLPAFRKALIEGDAYSVMASYNLWNGTHCCHNKRLLQTILRDEWGYQGTIISDWNGTHDTDEAIHNGLDLEMGTKGGYYLDVPYLERLKRGEVDDTELNEKVRHVLRLNFLTAMRTNKPWGSIRTQEHKDVAYRVATEAIVLLKNNGVLPLHPEGKRILVVGENAMRQMTIGGGSSTLKAQREVTPLEGLREVMPADAIISFARGYVGDTTNTYNGYSSRINMHEERSPEQLIDEAVSMAKQADLIIFVGGLNKSTWQEREGFDRKEYGLPYGQNELIERLLVSGKPLVIVNISGNAVEMPWVEKPAAIVHMGYLGSEAGHALADVLVGKVNPSGRLPFTWMRNLNDYPAHYMDAYHAEDGVIEEYKEDIFLGYRYSDLPHTPEPLFRFGYGLSYTTFGYRHLQTQETEDGWDVTINVTNQGTLAGKEVVMAYVGQTKTKVARPVRELKAFTKVELNPGETQKVQLHLQRQSLARFDENKHAWVIDEGRYVLEVGPEKIILNVKNK